RHHIADEFDNFSGHLRSQASAAGDISGRPGEALRQPGSDHVSAESADDWNLTGRLLGGNCGRREPGHDHIYFEPYQFRCQFGKTAHLSLVRSELEPYILPLDVTEFAQHLGKQLPKSLRTGSVTHQNANGCHLWLLRPRRVWPRYRAADRANKFPPLDVNCH